MDTSPITTKEDAIRVVKELWDPVCEPNGCHPDYVVVEVSPHFSRVVVEHDDWCPLVGGKGQ